MNNKTTLTRSTLLTLTSVLCGLIMSHAAWSRGHVGEFALGYGLSYSPWVHYGFYGYPYPYGYPYFGYAYPPVIAIPTTPPVYIEKNAPAPLEPNYWYYCRKPDGYYPYVRECPGGWIQVAPQPPTR